MTPANKSKSRTAGAKYIFLAASLIFAQHFLTGCAVVGYFKPEAPPSDLQICESYYRTILGISSSVDVLSDVHRPAYELLSQSSTVIASSGQKKQGHKFWFNMVAFDEQKLTAARKYLFIADTRPKSFGLRPKRKLLFFCEFFIDTELLDKPYANANARQIAIFQQAHDTFGPDIEQVRQDNKNLDICGMVVNQTLTTILQKLNDSPALASKLGAPKGLAFDHPTFGKGFVSMNVADNLAELKVKIDSPAAELEDPFALRQ